MIKPLVILYLLFEVCSAFDNAHFMSKYCTEINNSLLYCSGFKWTTQEKSEIQNSNFVISLASRIELDSVDIGALNENFINKFPNAVEVVINNCDVYLNSSRTRISQMNTKLKTLKIEHSVIHGNKDSIAFNLLAGLNTFELAYPIFKDSSEIDSALLSKNVNLNSVTLSGQNIGNISINAFENLKKLQILNIVGTSFKSFPPALLRNNQKLEALNLGFNKIDSIQAADFFPVNLKTLALNNNQITFLNNMHFKVLPNLSELNLRNNGLLVLSPTAFNDLKVLKILNLENNKLQNITRQHFEKNLLLKEIYLSGNELMGLPNDIFDGLNYLERVKADVSL